MVRNCLRIIVAVALAVMSIAGIGGVVVAAGTGAITGYVYIESTTTELTATVTVYDSDGVWVGLDVTGSGGYSIGGLTTGDYYVKAEADGYFPEYYDGATLFSAATKVHVTDGSATTGKNFFLSPGRSIRGTVYDNATQPIGRAYVEVVDNVTQTITYGSDYSDDNGTYAITVAPGTYRVRAWASGKAMEYYDNQAAFGSANPVVLTDAADTTGIDFSLAATPCITGHVLQADNVTPIVGVMVAAYNTSGSNVAQGRSSSDNGSYYINLTAGTYRILATFSGYVPQWWDDDGTNVDYGPEEPNPVTNPYWADAGLITVTDNETPNHDFILKTRQAVATNAASSLSVSGATLNGSLASMGAAASVNVSFDWGLTNSYGNTAAATAMTETGAFSAQLTGLSENVTYHCRARAVGAVTNVISLGADIAFTTSALGPPVVTTDTASGVTTTTATLNGNLVSTGTTDGVVVSFEWGTAAGSYTQLTENQTLSATGRFSASLTGLTHGTTYYFRAKADGDGDPVYGAEMSFTALVTPPTVATGSASSIAITSATLNGNVSDLGTAASANVCFEWKVSGGTYAPTTVQTLTAAGAFSAALTNLADGTTYYFRAKADGDGDPVYGAEMSFTTVATDKTGPVVSSVEASDKTSSGATVRWATDEAATSQVEYGLTAEYGSLTDVDTSMVTTHSVALTGLKAGKTYHVRVISKDAAGNQTTSDDMTFSTTEGSGGMPAWAWVLIGIACVGVVGGAVAFLLKARAAKPQ